ncbi:hypothetical protein OQA88_13402 [Cercophora sp. LCS_1]
MAQSGAAQQGAQAENEDEWEYEYSTTETETYYLTLDLSVRDFLERRPEDDKVIHNRGGYRIWYNPLFTDHRFTGADADADGGDDNQPPGDEPERDKELENLGLPQQPDEQDMIDPQLQEPPPEEPKTVEAEEDKVIDEIQILDLHSNEPLVSYRNHIFRGTWSENIGTEMIFTRHNETAPLPAIRRLQRGIDLIAASSARISFREATLRLKSDEEEAEANAALDAYGEPEDLPERYKRNGGVYIHIGGDKSGHRQPQAHFLEDLIALKRKRGETDDVTVQPLETRYNQLMHEDEAEEKRRKKLQVDQARALKWRENRKGEDGLYPPVEVTAAPMREPKKVRGRGGMRGRQRRPLILRDQEEDTVNGVPSGFGTGFDGEN